MHLIACPWCGPREETEFSFGGQAHVAYPADPSALSDEQWARFEADLAERLTTLVTDTEAAKTMGKAARRRVEEHFAWEAIAQRTMDVYNWVLAQG